MNMLSSDKIAQKEVTNEEFDNYMDSIQLDFFRNKLESWLEELDREHNMKSTNIIQANIDADQTDWASKQFSDDIELSANDRYFKLKKDIQNALKRIDDGTYGYCESTGEKIGIERLKVNPTTLYCIEEQERREKEDKISSQ